MRGIDLNSSIPMGRSASGSGRDTAPKIRLAAVIALCLLAVAVFTGCAAVTVKKIPRGDAGSVEGIRFYRPVPYLMVSHGSADSGKPSANEGVTLQFTIVWMPDLSQEYAIQAKSGPFGSVTFNPTLKDGWNLTGLNATVDSKTAELLTAVRGLVPKAWLAPNLPAAENLKPGMYRFVFQTDASKPNYGQLDHIDWANPVFTIAAK